MTILMLLALGVVEVAFVLYGRNVLAASAHEGARAAIELGRDRREAAALATSTVRRAAGGLIDRLDVSVDLEEQATRTLVRVRVGGVIRALGPVPIPIPVSVEATASRPELLP